MQVGGGGVRNVGKELEKGQDREGIKKKLNILCKRVGEQ